MATVPTTRWDDLLSTRAQIGWAGPATASWFLRCASGRPSSDERRPWPKTNDVWLCAAGSRRNGSSAAAAAAAAAAPGAGASGL